MCFCCGVVAGSVMAILLPFTGELVMHQIMMRYKYDIFLRTGCYEREYSFVFWGHNIFFQIRFKKQMGQP